MIRFVSEVLEESMDVLNVVLDYRPDALDFIDDALITGLYLLHTTWEWLGNK